jgi:hypothetical protein
MISGREEGTCAAASAGRPDGAGTAARAGCGGECTGATALSLQQLLRIYRCVALGNLARASLCVMQAVEP